MTVSSCPDSRELQKLVQGTLAPAAQAALELHLGGCAHCQAVLERLTAGMESWGDMAQQLAQPAAAVDPALANVMDKLRAEAPGETAAEHRAADESKLDFLDPPEKPGQLGKLAHYEVLELIGRGGMGIVLKAFDPKLHRVVAIKVMAPQLATGATGRKRFLREAQAVAAVSHDHIVHIYAVDETNGLPYLVMQYIAGRSLQQRIDETGALEVKEILRIGLQAAHGLAAAHAQGLVHRDIKPANILLENGIERVKITDFGLALAAHGARVTQTGVVTGSPQYMAPEQARGEAVDHRSDLFSLGGVMYSMCTGYSPFRASSSLVVLKKVCDETPRPIADLNPEIPDWLTAIVEKLMAKDPEDRFQSATEVAALLGQHLAHLQQPAVFRQPAEVARLVEPKPAIQPAKGSLALPILVIVAPFVLVPVLLISLLFLDLDFHYNRLILGLSIPLGALCVLLGVILLIVQLSRRSAAVPVETARPAAPPTKRQTSNSWGIAVVVVLAALAVLSLPFLVTALMYFGFGHIKVEKDKTERTNGSISKARRYRNRRPKSPRASASWKASVGSRRMPRFSARSTSSRRARRRSKARWCNHCWKNSARPRRGGCSPRPTLPACAWTAFPSPTSSSRKKPASRGCTSAFPESSSARA